MNSISNEFELSNHHPDSRSLIEQYCEVIIDQDRAQFHLDILKAKANYKSTGLLLEMIKNECPKQKQNLSSKLDNCINKFKCAEKNVLSLVQFFDVGRSQTGHTEALTTTIEQAAEPSIDQSIPSITIDPSQSVNLNGKNNKFHTLTVQCSEPSCNHILPNILQLEAHLEAKHQILPFRCYASELSDCRQSFRTKSELEHHGLTFHQNNQIWNCVSCKRNFRPSNRVVVALDDHFKRCHYMGQFKCLYCDTVSSYPQQACDHYVRKCLVAKAKRHMINTMTPHQIAMLMNALPSGHHDQPQRSSKQNRPNSLEQDIQHPLGLNSLEPHRKQSLVPHLTHSMEPHESNSLDPNRAHSTVQDDESADVVFIETIRNDANDNKAMTKSIKGDDDIENILSYKQIKRLKILKNRGNNYRIEQM